MNGKNCQYIEKGKIFKKSTITFQYKTARSSELRQILAQRRNKVEADKTDAKESITEDFSFLRDYDKTGYQTDSGEFFKFYE